MTLDELICLEPMGDGHHARLDPLGHERLQHGVPMVVVNANDVPLGDAALSRVGGVDLDAWLRFAATACRRIANARGICGAGCTP